MEDWIECNGILRLSPENSLSVSEIEWAIPSEEIPPVDIETLGLDIEFEEF